MKSIYSYLHHISSTNSVPSHVYTTDTHPTCNNLETAETFNSFFHSTFTVSQYELPVLDQLPSPKQQLHSISIDCKDVYTAIASLDISKAYGCDDISPHLISLCAHHLVPFLTDLFNMSLQTASVPQQWKLHKIIPTYKKGSRSLVSNYRPISLLCCISRLLESIIYHKIIHFIRPLLSTHQFGFLSNRSCLLNLLMSYSEIFQSLDNSHIIDAIYLDFSKAFDTLPHSRLLFKLWQFGITGQLWYIGSRLISQTDITLYK